MITKHNKNQIIKTLEDYQPERIGIFGSYARNENRKDSDLDILVSFKRRISLLKLVQLQQELSDKLGISVDLVTENSLKDELLKEYIYQDLIMIYDGKERFHLSPSHTS